MRAPLGGCAPRPALQCAPVAEASQTPGRALPFSGRLREQSPGRRPGPLQPLLGAGLAPSLQLSAPWPLQWEPGVGQAGGRWAEGGEKTRTTLQTHQAPSGWTVPVARTSWSWGQADLTGRVRAPAVVRGPRRCLRSQVVGAHPAPPPAWSEGGPDGGSDSSESRGFGGAEWGRGDRTRRSRLPAPCSGLCRARRACVPAWVGAAAQTPVLSRDRLRAEPRGSPWPARPRPPAQVPTAPHVGGRIVLCGGLSDALEDVWPLPTRCH